MPEVEIEPRPRAYESPALPLSYPDESSWGKARSEHLDTRVYLINRQGRAVAISALLVGHRPLCGDAPSSRLRVMERLPPGYNIGECRR
jgi:hypothetical protein